MADPIKARMQQRAQQRAGLTLERLRQQAARMETHGDALAVDVPLGAIEVDEAIQVRVAGVDPDKVAQYAVVFDEGGEFPPVVVFRDGESDTLYLADGFHRVAAAERAGLESIAAEVRPGGRAAAIEYAEEANLEHGFALTNRDKRYILARRIRRGHEWALWSDRQIAQVLGVAHTTIGRWRQAILEEMQAATGANAPVTTERVGADGRVYNVENVQEANRRRAKMSQRYLASVMVRLEEKLDRAGGSMEFNELIALDGVDKEIAERAVRMLAQDKYVEFVGVGDEIWVSLPGAVEKRQEPPSGTQRVRYVDGAEFNQDVGDEVEEETPARKDELTRYKQVVNDGGYYRLAGGAQAATVANVSPPEQDNEDVHPAETIPGYAEAQEMMTPEWPGEKALLHNLDVLARVSEELALQLEDVRAGHIEISAKNAQKVRELAADVLDFLQGYESADGKHVAGLGALLIELLGELDDGDGA